MLKRTLNGYKTKRNILSQRGISRIDSERKFLLLLLLLHNSIHYFHAKINYNERSTKSKRRTKQNFYFSVSINCLAHFSIAAMWSGPWFWECLFHIFVYNISNPFAYCLQSNSGLSALAFHTLARIPFRYSRSVPKRIAICSYSWRVRAISSGQPSVANWDAATLEIFCHFIFWFFEKKNDVNYREAKVSPGRVTTGVPVHNTSIDVVWPLHNGVSKQTSANWPRRTCSSLAATLENIIWPSGRPVCKLKKKNASVKDCRFQNYSSIRTLKTHEQFCVADIDNFLKFSGKTQLSKQTNHRDWEAQRKW